MRTIYKPNVLLARFNRGGGEGHLTKIIDKQNFFLYNTLLSDLGTNEEGLIAYYPDEMNWVLITNLRIICVENGERSEIQFETIVRVRKAIEAEFQAGNHSGKPYSRIAIENRLGEEVVVRVEPGQPYAGLLKLLYFMVMKNHQNNE